MEVVSSGSKTLTCFVNPSIVIGLEGRLPKPFKHQEYADRCRCSHMQCAFHMNTSLCLTGSERIQPSLDLEHEDEYLEAQCRGADFPHTDAPTNSCNSLGIQVSKEITLPVRPHPSCGQHSGVERLLSLP